MSKPSVLQQPPSSPMFAYMYYYAQDSTPSTGPTDSQKNAIKFFKEAEETFGKRWENDPCIYLNDTYESVKLDKPDGYNDGTKHAMELIFAEPMSVRDAPQPLTELQKSVLIYTLDPKYGLLATSRRQQQRAEMQQDKVDSEEEQKK